MWNENTTQVAPRNFKFQIGQFAEQFAGYGQQDSMEFIEYVLDGLKEDVNKVQGAKPYVESKEADGRPDLEVATEARDAYRSRNNSVVDELFLAWLKSTVSCPEPGCGRVSVKFDPATSVKLPLVSVEASRSTSFEVAFCSFRAPQVPIAKHTVTVNKDGTALDILEAVGKLVALDAACLMMVEHWNGLHKFFDWNDKVDSIQPNDHLVVYEQQADTGSSSTTQIIINCRQADAHPTYWRNGETKGIPFPTYVDRNATGRQLMDVVSAEFERRLGNTFEGKWRLLRANAKTDVASTSDEIDLDRPANLQSSRNFIVVDFEQGVTVPEVLTNMYEPPVHRYGSTRNASPPTDIMRCFRLYTETTKLSAMDTWYCSKCKEHREAYKQMEFWELPPVLIIQLMRFQYNHYTRDRLDTPVSYPLENLDLREFVIGPTKEQSVYDLAALSKHMGGLGGGHYVAYSRSSENGKWYYYNDSMVQEVSTSEVANDTVGAYVLFYIRRDRRPACWA